MSEHDLRFPPSAAERWLTCTASVELIAMLPPDKRDQSSVYAIEGTAAHWLFAEYLTHRQDTGGGSAKQLYVRLKKSGNQLAEYLKPEMIEHIEDCADYVEQLGLNRYDVEQRVHIPVTGGAGNADVVGWVSNGGRCVLHVVDLKYGQGVQVFAEDNPQLSLYGLGAYDQLVAMLDEIDEVHLHILQPRLNHFDVHKWSAVDLLMWSELDVAPKVEEALAGGVFRPSDAACRWCPLQTDCTAYHEAATAELLEEFDEVRDPEDVAPAAKGLDPTALSRLLSKRELLKMLLSAIETEAHARLSSGAAVPGFKLVQGKRGARKWTEEGQVLARLAKQTELSEDDYAPRNLVSPTQLEKLSKLRYSQLKRYVEQPAGRPVLATEDDSRPAVEPTSKDEFDNV